MVFTDKRSTTYKLRVIQLKKIFWDTKWVIKFSHILLSSTLVATLWSVPELQFKIWAKGRIKGIVYEVGFIFTMAGFDRKGFGPPKT